MECEYKMNTKLPALALAACLTLSLTACGTPQPVSLFGDLVDPAGAVRTIVLTPDTRWVNVEGGQIIRFVVGNQSFGWAFNVSQNVDSFDLARVAPPGLLTHPVIAYVSPDPKYIRD
jgi:hypothetical protein